MAFFFNDAAITEIYTLSLRDALPIATGRRAHGPGALVRDLRPPRRQRPGDPDRHRGESGRSAEHRARRSEEHTSELQSRQYLVCRLLLEKKISSVPISLHSFCRRPWT